MEPKVVNKCLQKDKNKKSSEDLGWYFNEESSFYKQGGSGNNWALGHFYFGQNQNDITDRIVKTQLEKIDNFGGFHVL